ncbi:hypothetical protein ACFL6F_00420 [Planctomycetota bacterium]
MAYKLYFKYILLSAILAVSSCSLEVGDTKEADPYTPVLKPGPSGDWDERNVVDPCVIYGYDPISASDKYIMYYSGCDNAETYQIGYAISDNGKSWMKPDLGGGDNICLSNGAAVSWSEGGIIGPQVIKVGAAYHMWYTGYDDSNNFQIGYASSPDGVDWTPDALPVLSPTGNAGDFDESHIRGVAVYYDGDYHVYYTGINSQGYAYIAYITTAVPNSMSNAGASLAQLGPASNTYHSGGLRAPSVLYDSNDTTYKMWPTASASLSSIGYAESSFPGSGWLITTSPVLTAHSTGFDAIQVALCCVIKHPLSSGFLMWYSGWSSDGVSIGYASSSNGYTWDKYMK